MKSWVAISVLLLTADYQMQIQVFAVGTTTKYAVMTKPMTSVIQRHFDISTKKKSTALLATQREKFVTSRIVGTKTEFNSSFWNTNTTTVSIAAHQGLFNLNRPKVRYRNKNAGKKQHNKQQRRRQGNKNTIANVRRTTLRPTTSNTFQYKRYMPNKWDTSTIVFVKVWTKASTNDFYRQRTRKPGGSGFFTTTYFPPTRKINQWIPSQPVSMSTPNYLPPDMENYNDNKVNPHNNGPQYGGDEYEDQPLILPTKSSNRNPSVTSKPSIKTTQGYEDEEYDDPVTKPTTRITKKSNADDEYEEDEYEDEKPAKTTISKKTTKKINDDEVYDEPSTTVKMADKAKTSPKTKPPTEEEDEKTEETDSSEMKQREEEMRKIVSTQMYVPDVPVVTSKTVTFPKNLDKNAPDPDYKDKTVDVEAELFTTQKYTTKKVNIFDPNFGKE